MKVYRLFLIFALLPAALSAAPAIGASKECITSALKALLARTPDSPPVLKVLFKPDLQTSRDLSRRVESVRRHIVPNSTYAHSHPWRAYVEVSKIAGLEHSYLAIFNHSDFMNHALGRFTTYESDGRLISDRALTQINSQVHGIAGHDVSPKILPIFIRKFAANRSLGISSSEKMQIETDFWRSVMLPILEKDSKAVLIAAAMDYHPAKILSHEILHANLYENNELRKTVTRFWDHEVSEADRKTYLKVMKQYGYDPENRDLVINEFLAYTLEYGKTGIFPARLIKRYRARLSDYLEADGIHPVQLVGSHGV